MMNFWSFVQKLYKVLTLLSIHFLPDLPSSMLCRSNPYDFFSIEIHRKRIFFHALTWSCGVFKLKHIIAISIKSNFLLVPMSTLVGIHVKILGTWKLVMTFIELNFVRSSPTRDIGIPHKIFSSWELWFFKISIADVVFVSYEVGGVGFRPK